MSNGSSGTIANMIPKYHTVFAYLIVLVISLSSSEQTDFSNALMYLSRFGYLDPQVTNPNSGQLMSQDTLTDAVKDFQAFAGLNVTGELDKETVTLMQLPRCGVKDKVGFASNSRSKRYALQGSRWKVKDLTYKISKYPRNLPKKDVDEEIQKAFDVWGTVTPLKFTKKSSGPVHIDVRFERGEHGDGDPFDGPGGTLAHAFFPVYGGDAHFDDAEKWTINSYRGTNLFQVAAHEFGHSLGLSHSDIRSALMAPFYRGFDPSFELDEDDIIGIQALYGKKKSTSASNPGSGSGGKKPTSEEETPATEEDKELCSGNSIDTMFNSAEGITYVFKGKNYWRLTDDAVAAGYPKPISKSWPGLPGDIDAAFTYKNGKTYFFKGNQYWRYVGNKMDGRYPKKISEGFAGAPDNMDAAMVWGGNGKIYFFKGSKFWRFDPTQKPPIKSNYPKPIANWEGVPDNLDAVLQYTNGYTYFFKKGNYYRFNDRSFSVDTADPPFPRPTGYWWFGCKSESKRGITEEDYSDLDNNSALRRESEQMNDGPHDEITDIIMDSSDIHPLGINL